MNITLKVLAVSFQQGNGTYTEPAERVLIETIGQYRAFVPKTRQHRSVEDKIAMYDGLLLNGQYGWYPANHSGIIIHGERTIAIDLVFIA